MNEGTCIHYTGLLSPGNPREKRCGAGVCYWDVFEGDKPGILLRIPCVQFRVLPAHRKGTYVRPGEETVRAEIGRKGNAAIQCEHLVLPTQDDVERDRVLVDDKYKKMLAAISVASEWRESVRRDSDRHGVVECPVCNGLLHLTQFASNGHVHGSCETDGCVRWME